MSIWDEEVKRFCSDGLHPFDVPGPQRRGLHVSTEIHDLLIGEDDERWWDIQPDLEQFVEGREPVMLRRVDSAGDRDEPAFMVRLSRRSMVDPEEVWEIRVTWVNPQVRLFGRFFAKDHFIALTWHERDGLDFSSAMLECASLWKDLFGLREPVRGDYPRAYLFFLQICPLTMS